MSSCEASGYFAVVSVGLGAIWAKLISVIILQFSHVFSSRDIAVSVGSRCTNSNQFFAIYGAWPEHAP